MNAYRLPRIAELTNSLRLSPGRLRLQQILATDHLITLIDPEQYYPYSWVCWHITGYKAPLGEVDAATLRGSALTHDLLLLCHDLTRRNPIPQAVLPWPVWSMPELAERLNVSTKTISRWRDDGLPAWWTVRPDGEIRLCVPESGLRRFTVAHLDNILRSRRFSQLTDKQREDVLERAQQLRAGGCTSMHRICHMIATELGRSVETIRYTLVRHDPATAQLRTTRKTENSSDEHKIIFDCFQSGDTAGALAQRFGKTVRTVRKIILSQQRCRLLSRKVAFLYSPEFDLPDAESRILSEPQPFESPVREPALAAATSSPAGTSVFPDSVSPTDARCVIMGTVDPLTANEELATFRRYNYCKFRLAGLQQQLRKTASAELVEQAADWCRKVETLRARLVETNLRLVVAVAKRHLRYGASLEEMASEGNMILMRAIEKFDYTRGFKFSTYVSWAIMRHFSRLMPLWETSRRRQQTGCEDILKTTSTDEPIGTGLEQQLLGGVVQQVLDNLSKRERKIIQWHYGLPDGATPRSLSQIATKLGISKERVRQIKDCGLDKLKTLLDERQFQYL